MSRVIDKPYMPEGDQPEESVPDAPRVEPGEGPVPAVIPYDPERERVIDPASNPVAPVALARGPRWLVRWS